MEILAHTAMLQWNNSNISQQHCNSKGKRTNTNHLLSNSENCFSPHISLKTLEVYPQKPLSSFPLTKLRREPAQHRFPIQHLGFSANPQPHTSHGSDCPCSTAKPSPSLMLLQVRSRKHTAFPDALPHRVMQRKNCHWSHITEVISAMQLCCPSRSSNATHQHSDLPPVQALSQNAISSSV